MGALALFALLTARATQALGPESPHAPLYNSDCAVPVLMCQLDHWSLFDVYYYGQDRFGAWPFLLTRAAAQLFGFHPTHVHLHVWLTAWLFSGAFVIGALGRGLRLLAAGLYILVILVQPEVRLTLFDLAQVYPWQLTTLLLAWWSLRRGNELAVAHARGTVPRRAVILASARTFLLSFLAIWTNSVSGPLLVFLGGGEALRSRLIAPEAFPGLRSLRRWGEAVLLVGIPFALEATLRGFYHRFSRRHFAQSYSTTLDIDWGHLGENARAVLDILRSSSSLPWLMTGTVGALVAAVFLWRTLRSGTRRDDPLLEGAVLLLATWGLAVAHVPLLTVLNHVRHNGYNVRYFLPVSFFGTLSGALALTLAVWLLPRLSRLYPRTLDALGAVALAVGAWSLPASETSPEFVELQATATRLAQRKPGVPLLGGYWDTYVAPTLQREGALIPVPHEGSYPRTVWLARMMKKYPEVVVDHGDFAAAGSAEAPSPWLFQYQTLLHLEQPGWERGAGHTFSLYRNVLAESQPHTTQPAPTEWDLCSPGTSLTLSFTPRQQALVMVALRWDRPEVTLTAEPLVEGSGSRPVPVTLRANVRLHLATLDGGGTMLRGVRITASPVRTGKPPDQRCGAEATFVMDPAMDAAR